MSILYVISPPREIFEGIRPEVRQHIVMLPDFLRYPSGRFKGITRSLLAGRIPLPKRILYYCEFATAHSLTPSQAYRYLDRFKGIDFVTRFYDVEHTFSFEDVIADLTSYCHRKGGALV